MKQLLEQIFAILLVFLCTTAAFDVLGQSYKCVGCHVASEVSGGEIEPPIEVKELTVPKTGQEMISTINMTLAPNPCQDYLKISANLVQAETVSIDLYNSNGQLIRQLTNQESLRKGQHVLTLNAQDLPSGVYYCILTTVSQRVGEKIIKL